MSSGFTDIHCHILPGVDDGARNERESLDMLQAAASAGITHIYCTPHYRWDDFDLDAVQRAFSTFRKQAHHVGIRTDLGFEVHWRKLINEADWSHPETIRELCMGSTHYLLLEFSNQQLPAMWPQLIERLTRMRITPVIAHPERYKDVQNDIEVARKLIDAGCLIQVSANFIDHPRRDPVLRTAQQLIKANLVRFVASDAHRPEDYQLYTRALAALS